MHPTACPFGRGPSLPRAPHRPALLAAGAALLGLALAGPPAPGAELAYTEAQAEAGEKAYEELCASCHGSSLAGTHLSPSLVGDRFDQQWRGKSLEALSFHVHRMPPETKVVTQRPSEQTYTNLVAYLLHANGIAPTDVSLPAGLEAQRDLQIPKLDGVELDPDAPVELSRRQKIRLGNLSAVTADMLRTPPAEDWLQWGRTQDGQNSSPLNQISRDTVAELQPAWRTPLRPGLSMAMPLVHDGVMFLHTFPDTILAIDATNGQVLWRHRYEAPTGSSQKMGLALFGDKVFVPTSDLHVLAIDSKTGERVWDHAIVTEAPKTSGRGGYQLRSAPLVAGDKVIQGVTASFMPRGGFILALDLEAGEEAWRFNTIARPGEPGGDTWNDVPLDERSGGSVWHQGTYDPELGLVYYGVAPTYDTGPLLHPVEKDDISSEALYTNCTVALDVETGKLAWYYQHLANDQWDLDWVFERQLVELPVDARSPDGEKRKVVLNVGKMAIVEALDAATGEYLFSVDLGVQNVITAIDPETGAKTIDPDQWPDPEKEIVICPSAFGSRSWPPTSYSSRTGLLYLPLTEWCMGMGPEGFRLLTSGVGLTSAAHPDSSDGKLGSLQAVDVAYRELAWRHDQVSPLSTSLLATAGGLVFSGDLDPSLKAFDERTGELLWSGVLDDRPSSGLVTYEVDGRQYVAVVVGLSNNHVRDLGRTFDAFRESAGLGPDERPRGGPAVWAFALPES